MIGNQAINTFFEFIYAMGRTCGRQCCGRNKSKNKKQWEKDHLLHDFNANTLFDEYLELGSNAFLLRLEDSIAPNVPISITHEHSFSWM